MNLLAIDPGANAGVARFKEDHLVEALLVGDQDHTAIMIGSQVDQVVCELPIAYTGGRSKVDPNDLIKLAFRAGRLTSGVPWDKVRLVRPVSWKGNVPDDILYKRIHLKLRPNERLLLRTAQEYIAKTKFHNVLDAVGIGLYILGRMGMGGV